MENSTQVGIDHYEFNKYVDIDRWKSYWCQINEVITEKPEKILIIGTGDNIVGDYLMKQRISIETLDFDIEMHPNYLGSVENIEEILDGKKFDTILCCQVLEHLPFEKFEETIKQLKNCMLNTLILSLPYSHIGAEFVLSSITKIRLPKVTITLTFPKFFKQWKFNEQHYWEIGAKGYSKNRITKILRKYFVIEGRYLVPQNTYHMFFILRRTSRNLT